MAHWNYGLDTIQQQNRISATSSWNWKRWAKMWRQKNQLNGYRWKFLPTMLKYRSHITLRLLRFGFNTWFILKTVEIYSISFAQSTDDGYRIDSSSHDQPFARIYTRYISQYPMNSRIHCIHNLCKFLVSFRSGLHRHRHDIKWTCSRTENKPSVSKHFTLGKLEIEGKRMLPFGRLYSMRARYLITCVVIRLRSKHWAVRLCVKDCAFCVHNKFMVIRLWPSVSILLIVFFRLCTKWKSR